MQKIPPIIVDIEGLAKALRCSKSYLYEKQRWKELLHVVTGDLKFDLSGVYPL